MQKLYCYVDESGQDTEGQLFIVSVVIAQAERDTLISILEEIERQSGKGRQKWVKAKDADRVAYIRAVFQHDAFRGKLYYGMYAQTLAYSDLTVATIADTINAQELEAKYKANVLIDGLHDSERNAVAVKLREHGIRTDNVRGVDDEHDILIRLADAACGFIRDALGSRVDFAKLMTKAVRDGFLIQVGE